jgi:hypothetical protein
MENEHDLVARFVKNRHDFKTAQDFSNFVADIRDEIEKQGRLYELKEMIRYHLDAADRSQTDDERTTHLADIVVLEARISFLETPRETPPITSN